jgi:hypothetical protein
MPRCSTCGRELSPRASTCPGCGEPGPAAGPTVAGTLAAVSRFDGYAIASIACSASAFFGVIVVGSVLGIIFGKMARTRLAANPQLEGEGLAQIGIILGWVGLAIGVLFLLLGLAMFAPLTRASGFMRVGF